MNLTDPTNRLILLAFLGWLLPLLADRLIFNLDLIGTGWDFAVTYIWAAGLIGFPVAVGRYVMQIEAKAREAEREIIAIEQG
jgi:hypothetical protein